MAEKKMAASKVSTLLLLRLNEAIARELQASIKHMRLAEAIAEQLFYLGETPAIEPNPIIAGAINIKERIGQDVNGVETAIKLYKQIAEMAREEGDETTHRLFRTVIDFND